jgi:3D (Asp-Asp-Asp) domain-containing protein
LAGVPLLFLAAAVALTGFASGPAPESLPGDPAVAEFEAGIESVAPQPQASLPTEEGEPLVFHEIVVTGYASRRAETDASPTLTASMTSVSPGCLALSRDLLRTFTSNAPFDFGDWVLLPGVGVFKVQDTMADRWERRGDIWFPTRDAALQWGSRRVLVGRITHPTPEISSLVSLSPYASALSHGIRFQQ